MKISITQLHSQYWYAQGERLNDWAQWPVGDQLRDEHFFLGSSNAFKIELRKQLKKANKLVGTQA